jgi:hypothetical protein
MKKQLFFVAIAGLTLVSAAPPADPIPWEDEASLRDYPRCSRTVTDRCIQSNERGVARREKLARSEEPRSDARGPAVGAPAEPVAHKYAASDYPPCSRTVTDRCIQTNRRGSHAATHRMARSAPKAKHHAAPMRLAMRAGERG